MIYIPKELLPLARSAQALAELVDIAKKSNSFEQLEIEHKARLAAITKDADAVKAEVAAAKDAIAAAKAEAAKLLADAKSAGEKAAAAMLAEANAERAKATEALAAAKKAEAFSEAEERRAKKRLEGLLAEIAAVEPKLAEAKATIARAEGIAAALKG